MESPPLPPLSFWREYWIGIRPFTLAQLIDLTRLATLWVSVGIAHLIQRFFLSLGWLPLVVHILEFAENVLLVVTVVIFLLLAAMRTLWFLYREVRKNDFRAAS